MGRLCFRLSWNPNSPNSKEATNTIHDNITLNKTANKSSNNTDIDNIIVNNTLLSVIIHETEELMENGNNCSI